MISTYTVALTRRSGKRRQSGTARPIKVLGNAPRPTSTAVAVAEKLVVAARENVRFLNRHLRKYRASLELPAFVDNALYLAYTLRVKDTAPFDPFALRRYLHEAGIETTAAFSFDASENCDIVIDRNTSHRRSHGTDESAICIACHQYLTIPDLEYILDSFDSFFEQLATTQTKPESERG